MPDIFTGLANLWQKPAIHSEVLRETPPVDKRETVRETPAPREMQPVHYALEAQDSLLQAGFSKERAFAGALQALAWERPLVFNKSGKGRRMSQKASRHLRALAVSIVVEE